MAGSTDLSTVNKNVGFVTPTDLWQVPNKVNPTLQTKLNQGLQAQANQPLTPISQPTYKAPSASSTMLQPQNSMTLNDFINAAQKLGTQSFQAQADIIGQQNKDLVDKMARNLYSQNVGASSGIGQQVQLKALEDMNRQLAPYAQATAADVAKQELAYRQQETQQQEANRQNIFNMVLSGQVDKSQLSQTDYAQLGITDPNAIRTVQQMDIANAMVSQGLDPNNPNDQAAYRTQLKTQGLNTMKQGIISAYAQANNGAIPTQDEINALLLLSGHGTGILSPEEEQQLLSQFSQHEWSQQMQRAKQQYDATHKDGTVICTELHRQGLMSDEMYEADHLFGLSLDKTVMIGYQRWGTPLANAMKKSKLLTSIVKVPALMWAKEMQHRVTGKGKGSIIGRMMLAIGVPLCYNLGKGKVHAYAS